MKILITGANGFVGKNLVAYLRDNTNYELWTPNRDELDLLSSYDNDGQEGQGSVVSNLVYQLNKKNLDVVIHLAATVAGLPGNIGNQGLFGYENCQMGLNILEVSRLVGIKKLINISTVCGYHDTGPKPFEEENYWNGLPHESNRGYGMAKRFLVMLGIEYERQYGMNITNLIPINLVGEHDQSDHVIIDMIRKFENSNGKPVVMWGLGNAKREFCDVLDLCRAIKTSINKNTGAWPINIGTGIEISINNLANLIKKLGNYKSEIIWDPSKPEGQNSRCLNISKAKQILGWEPIYTLHESLERTILGYRNENRLALD